MVELDITSRLAPGDDVTLYIALGQQTGFPATVHSYVYSPQQQLVGANFVTNSVDEYYTGTWYHGAFVDSISIVGDRIPDVRLNGRYSCYEQPVYITGMINTYVRLERLKKQTSEFERLGPVRVGAHGVLVPSEASGNNY